MNLASKAALAIGAALIMTASAAGAGTFGGFGGREDAYLVGSDRICSPLAVSAGAARGAAACRTAGSDEVARLSVKTPVPERGAQATFAATARGRTITVSRRDGGAVVAVWESPDPISRVVEVYASAGQRLVAVAYQVRRAGREMEEVVAFDLRTATAPAPAKPLDAKAPDATAPDAKPDAKAPGAKAPDAPPTSPALTRAVTAARATKNPRQAAAAWARVLTLDADHSEARFGLAAARARARQPAEAVAALEALAASTRPDAIEWRVAARFDAAFAALRGDARFRAAVGLDRPAGTFYEHLMGFGGSWEQSGTSCDLPEVHLDLTRDRRFQLVVRSRCEGVVNDARFRGRWSARDPALVLALPNQGQADDEVACAVERRGDEDAITCQLDADLAFTVKPVRR